MTKPRGTRAAPIPAPQGGWEVGAWAKGASIGRNKAYELLNGPTPPRNVKLGKLRRIIESPPAYLDRVEEIQRAQASGEAR